MKESIYTRERRLTLARDTTLSMLVDEHRWLSESLNQDDWDTAAKYANRIMFNCAKIQQQNNELEDVSAIIETIRKIDKRMQELEAQADA